MRNTKKIVLVILLILLIEALCLQVDPISFGIPFRSIEYRTRISESFLGEELPLGLSIEPILLICDISIAFLLALILIQCVPSFIIVPMLQGCLLGTLIGVTDFWLDKILPTRWLNFWYIMLVVIVPVIIYRLTLKRKWQKIAILIISFTTVTTYPYSFAILQAVVDNASGISSNFEEVLRLLTLTCVFSFECFVLIFLHRKVLSLVWRKKLLKSPSETAEDKAIPVVVEAEKAGQKNTLKRAILYASLFVIPSYIGHHFKTVRKMRNDDRLVMEAIESKLERLDILHYENVEIPNEPNGVPGKIVSWGMELEPESFNAGWNTSFTTEVRVDDEKFYTKVRKQFLVPWLQVEIHKK
jgi:hypothetical protein